jgi:hemoglobin/transferrin/lactoferrin receptor protein
MKSVSLLSCFALVIFACNVSWAEGPVTGKSTKQDDVLVVTVEGYPVPQSETPGSVGIVENETLNETAPIGVADAFANMAGVTKTSDSLWGSEVNIRGLGRNAVVLLIDGCRVNTATDINAQFGLIDPSTIERIEVLKGPISALYGSGTIGGVVNVITRKGKFSEVPGWDTNLISSGMSNPLGLSTYASSAYNSPDAYVFGSQSFREYASFKDGNGDTMRNSQFYDYGSNLKGGYKSGEDNVTEFQFQVHQGRDVGIRVQELRRFLPLRM